eukprot:gene24921-26890_t
MARGLGRFASGERWLEMAREAGAGKRPHTREALPARWASPPTASAGMRATPVCMTAPKPRAIIALDLLRFASALLVVAFHYGAAFALAPSPAARAMLHGLPVSAALAGESWFGWVGVELFFMMSGFVIALSAEGTSGPAFVRRRALRLLPAAWICASATLLVLALCLP